MVRIFVCVAAQVVAFEHGEILVAGDEHGVCHSGETFAETQSVYCVEQIAFAHAVVAKQSVDLGREFQTRASDILEIIY